MLNGQSLGGKSVKLRRAARPNNPILFWSRQTEIDMLDAGVNPDMQIICCRYTYNMFEGTSSHEFIHSPEI